MAVRSISVLAALIVLVALGVRLGAAVWWQSRLPAGQPFFFGDSASYWRLGQRIASGQPYEFDSPDARVFRAPGYPLVLAGMFRIVGLDAPVLCARALGALLGALAVALLIGWATWLFDARAGLVAGLIAALYPGAVAMSVFVLSEAAFCPLMIAQLWVWGMACRAGNSRSARWLAAAVGAIAACATLVRPSWLLFTPLVAACIVLCSHERRKQLGIGAVALIAFCAMLAPWWVRNYRVVGHFVPTTLQVGASLYDGLNPQATGGSDMRFVPILAAELGAADDRARVSSSDPFEYRLDRYMAAEALTWARAHPARVIELAAIKLTRLWNVWPNEAEFRNWPLRIVTATTYVPLLIAGLWGAWRFRHLGTAAALAWMPAIYLTVLHTVFVSSLRYREPAMLALVVLAAGAVTHGKRWSEAVSGHSLACAPR